MGHRHLKIVVEEIQKVVTNNPHKLMCSLSTSLMVFSTAFGTALFGILIDAGLSIEQISIISGIYIFISLFSLIIVRNRLNPIIV